MTISQPTLLLLVLAVLVLSFFYMFSLLKHGDTIARLEAELQSNRNIEMAMVYASRGRGDLERRVQRFRDQCQSQPPPRRQSKPTLTVVPSNKPRPGEPGYVV